MACDDLAEGHADEVALLVEPRIEGVDIAQHLDDLELLLVQGIAHEIALDRQRIPMKRAGWKVRIVS
ncbi:hypothetical protein NS226_05705 [Aureimonas ureilytica]|uniref:Uncharacterized protein n=1 Tax=Aureimonas ureilytica TaxID=401562 RepID=A0A175RBI3_9HYPH|nr:hypothetical protein NS226_05705 [Aureimonas ureilytica]